MPRLDTDGYLKRLGIPDPGEPSIASLRALHAAHAERVAYEAIEIQLGRPTTVDPYESAERIVARHRGGYCYHLNGAFSLLLSELGYDVVWHRAGVENPSDAEPPGAERANHLALTAHGLPSEESEWIEVLAEVFDLPLDDIDAAERTALWTRVRAAHEAWLARRARPPVRGSTAARRARPRSPRPGGPRRPRGPS